MAMGWVLLAIAAAAGAIALLRRNPRLRGNCGAAAYHQRSRDEYRERLHRRVVHYRASGALPRWDP
jgi:hypothetical protein